MRSLRGRLTLGITLVLAVVLAGAGVVVSRYVDRSERAALDDRLKRTRRALARDGAVGGAARAAVRATSAWTTSCRRPGRRCACCSTGASCRPSAARRRPGRPAPRDGLHTFEAGGERYRSYAIRPGRRSAGSRGWRSRRGWRRLERKLSELNRRLLGVRRRGAARRRRSASWFAADVLLRPLRRLRAATAGIAGTEDLDRRVPGDDGPAELRSLAASFNDMLARLGRSAADRERALAATRRFTADAGHELRTPLTSVQAKLSALSRHPDMPGGAARGDGRATRWRRTAGSSTCSTACRRWRAATRRRWSAATSTSPTSSRVALAAVRVAPPGRDVDLRAARRAGRRARLGAGAADPRRQPARQRGAPRRRRRSR